MQALLAWIAKIVLDWLLEKAASLFKSVEKQQEQKQIADDNVKKDEEALKSGDLNAIAKAGENLLNGRDSR